MICPHCQQEHLDHIKFCPTTGKKVEAVSPENSPTNSGEFCVNCGSVNKQGYKFCGSCGAQNPANEVVSTTTTSNEVVSTVTPPNAVTSNETAPISVPSTPSSATPNEQPAAASPDVASMVKEQLAKSDIKGKSKQFIEKVKATPLMLFPAILTVVLLLASAFFYADKIESNTDLFEDFLDFDLEYLLDEDLLKAELEDEDGDDVKIDSESFPLVSTTALLMNNVPFNFEVADSNYDEIDKISIKLLFVLLIFPILFIAIGSVVYGVLAKKNNWSIRDGVISFAVIYTVFMGIMAFIGKYKLSVKYEEYDEVYKTTISINPSIFTAMFNGLLLSAIISFVVIYITYYGKNVFKQLQTENIYAKFTVYAVGATFTGIIVNILLAMVALKEQLEEFSMEIASIGLPETLDTALKVTLGLGGWGTSLFGNFAATEIYSGDVHSESLSELLLSKVLLVIITIAILVAVGYFLSEKTNITVQQMAIFAAIFTAVQIVYMYFFNIKLEYIEGSDSEGMKMGITYMSGIIGSFILAFAGAYGGSYLRTYLANRPKQ
jgi:hypothetical protein